MTAPFSDKLISELKERSRDVTYHTNRSVITIDEKNAIEIAEQFNESLRDIYKAAMSHGLWPLRYIRNRNSFSLKEQLILAESEIGLVGVGGLGGHVAVMLSRLGIGKLVILDHDVFDETNLNRQIHCTTENIGELKSDEAYRQIERINPAVEVDSRSMRFESDEIGFYFKDSNLLVDGLDNAKDRLLLGKLAKQLGIPLVHGAVSGFEGRVMTVTPGDKDFGLLYNTNDDNPGLSSEQIEGTPVVAPAFIASLQVMEVVKILLDRGTLYANKIIHADLESGEFHTFEL